MREKTKVVQIDGDWPGLFICGQDAVIDLWNTIERTVRFLENPNDTSPMRIPTMRNLREFLAKLDEQIAAMLQDSFATAQEDMQARALVEARVDADRMLLATRSALQADGHLLSTSERAAIDRLMEALQQAIATEQDAKALEDQTQALAKGTEAFAAERMNQSIQKALAGQSIQNV